MGAGLIGRAAAAGRAPRSDAAGVRQVSRIVSVSVAAVFAHDVAKVAKKGRSQADVAS